MLPFQPGILAPLPPAARYLSFRLSAESKPGPALARLAERIHGEDAVVGLGAVTVAALGATVPGLRHAPAFTGPGVSVPSTPDALWIWLRGTDRGDLLHRGRALSQSVDDAFVLASAIDGFVHDIGRDLSGYEDGTENPKGDAASEAAFSTEGGPGLSGSSFVAVQRWEHDLPCFEKLTEDERDACVGRRRTDNEELPDAPASAHVKRTAQESFEPAAFLLRRSMPYVDGLTAGLNFVAFGKSFDAFEAQLKRMVGLEDGITDALFRFTRPLTSSYLWCPPLHAGKLDLRAIGL